MAMVVPFLASQLVCCCSSAACHLCTARIPTTSSVMTRVAYAVQLLAVSMMAWTMMTGWLDSLVEAIPTAVLHDYHCPKGHCSGTFAVYRVMLSLTIYHALLSLLMIRVKNSKDARAGIQNGWWGPKLLLWMALLVACFFLPNVFFQHYWIVALVGGLLFILVQVVLLIDFAASWNESWVEKWENGNRGWLWGLIACTVIMVCLILVVSVLLYVYFCTAPGCGLNTFVVTFNLLLLIAVCILSLLPKVQEAKPSSGLLQASVVSLYATYLITSGIADETSDDNFNCNPLDHAGGQQISVALGTFFTFIVIAYSTTRAAAKSKILLNEEHPPDGHQPLSQNDDASPSPPSAPAAATVPLPPTPVTTNTDSAAAAAGSVPSAPQHVPDMQREQELIDMGSLKDPSARQRALQQAVDSGSLPASALESDGSGSDSDSDSDEESGGKKKKKSDELTRDDEKHGVQYNYSLFHFIFAIACMYVSMLITHWNTLNAEAEEVVDIGHSWASVWIKVVSSWVVFAIYAWTLFAPILFPDRQFN